MVVGSAIGVAPVETPIFATSMKKMIRHMTTSISGVTFTPPSFMSGILCFFIAHLVGGSGGGMEWLSGGVAKRQEQARRVDWGAAPHSTIPPLRHSITALRQRRRRGRDGRGLAHRRGARDGRGAGTAAGGAGLGLLLRLDHQQ